jgi:soluble lytic murein transglycosylase-like protein
MRSRVAAAVIAAALAAGGVALNQRFVYAMTDCWSRFGARIDSLSQRHEVSQALVLALVYHESGCNENAVRFEPHVYLWPEVVRRARGDRQERRFLASSYGVAQVLGVTARSMGYAGTPADFRYRSLEYGVRYLAGKYQQYRSWEDALASYNGGHGAVLRKKRTGSYGLRVSVYVKSVKVLRDRYGDAIIAAWRKAMRET